MSTLIKFDLNELRKLAASKNSCVIEKKVTQKLALQPWCLGNIKESIKNLLDYKIGKYVKEFDGILLSYKNVHILQTVGIIRNDNPEIYFPVQADFFIFLPVVGATLAGIVNKKSATHLGILLHKVFNVVIPSPTEEPGDKWIGASIQKGQTVKFRIVVLDLFGALPYIRGELDESSIKLGGPDEYDKLDSENTHHIVDGSYVEFDKTLPPSHIKNGNGSDTTQESPVKKSYKHSQRESLTNGTNTSSLKNIDCDDNIPEKPKKRRSKHLDDSIPDKSKKSHKKHIDSEEDLSETSASPKKKHRKKY